MKKITLFLFAICGILSSFAQQQGSFSLLNPDFINYHNKIKSGTQQFYTAEGHALGKVPSPVLPNFDAFYSSGQHGSTKFPAVYDLRTLNLLTPVKNQSNCGSCWTFATMGSIESYWKKQGLGNYDLSEQNLRTCHGFEYGSCYGGNGLMSTAYLSRRDGPVLETYDPYDTLSGALCNPGFIPLAYVAEARFLPKDTNIIKQTIIDYGALYADMYWRDSSYNSVNHTYYYNGNGSANHDILLVGWDNNKVTAGGTGAWIIKNSWGTTWGENGYFYISYNDTKVLSSVAYFPSRLAYNQNAFLYMHDNLGWLSEYGFGNSIAYGLLMYATPIIAPPDLQIKKIGLYINTAGTTVDVEIYDDFTGNVLSGLMCSLLNQVCNFPGYYTLTLPFPVTVGPPQNDVYIKVKYNTPGNNFPIPAETPITGYANPVIDADVCWISGNGVAWTKIGNNTAINADLCIRAYGGLPLYVSAGSDNTVCAGDSSAIGGNPTASGGIPLYSYSWSSSPAGFASGSANPVVSPAVTTTYFVTATDGEASSSIDNVEVIVNPAPDINLGSDTTICSDATLNFDAGTAYDFYIWSTGDTVPSITIDSSGTGIGTAYYWVTVIDSNNCASSDTIQVTFDLCTGIEYSPDDINVSFYPNPATGNIEIKTSQQAEIEIINIQGQIINNMAVIGNKTIVDLSAFPCGIYFVKVKTGKGIAIGKIIVE